MHNKEIAAKIGPDGDAEHLANFLDCIRGGKKPNADIEEAHRSTLLCHLGNIAQRTGKSLPTDPASGRILGDDESAALWGRQYAPGWEEKLG